MLNRDERFSCSGGSVYRRGFLLLEEIENVNLFVKEAGEDEVAVAMVVVLCGNDVELGPNDLFEYLLGLSFGETRRNRRPFEVVRHDSFDYGAGIGEI